MAVPSIIKQQGNRPSELFDTTKLHQSIVAVCLSVRSHEGEAETAAINVCRTVAEWLTTKPEVTSDDVRRKAAAALATYHPEAAYVYKHHRSVI